MHFQSILSLHKILVLNSSNETTSFLISSQSMLPASRCRLCLTDLASAILILCWFIRHLSVRPRISRAYLRPLPTLVLTMVVILLVNSDSVMTIPYGNFSMPPDFGGAKHLAGSQTKMLSSKRYSGRVSCCIRTQAIAAQHIYPHPTFTIFSGQTVSLAWHRWDRKIHSFAVMLCKVPSPYSMWPELFSRQALLLLDRTYQLDDVVFFSLFITNHITNPKHCYQFKDLIYCRLSLSCLPHRVTSEIILF